MADFEKAQAVVKLGEGGYTKNPNDAGNYVGGKVGVGALVGTNWGIAAPTYARYIKRNPTEADMRAMPYETAKAIYKEQYWKPVWGNFVANQSIANIMYDCIVNSWDQAFYFARQSILNQHIKVLGKDVVVNRPYFNQDILNAINSANQEFFFNDYKICRHKFYVKLGGVYVDGWLNRLDKFNYTA